jgi:NAD-dependent dihydropyrimidine dehydrogenase PreA subunit
VTYVVGLNCVDTKDKTCIAQCPVDCIYEGDRMLYIHPDECIDCGACEPACPVNAIVYESDATEEDLSFAAAARTMFDVLGSPGGAAIAGPIADPVVVASLPPKPAGSTS